MSVPARMDVNAQAGIFAHQRSGRAGVIQMDMREENGVEIGNRETVQSELFPECADG